MRTYLARAFGDPLKEIHLEMMALTASRPPEELNRSGFRLYQHFRPDVAKGAEGWGAKGLLHVDRIRAATGTRGV